MTLNHISNIDERADQLLQRVQDSVWRRDRLLLDIGHAINDDANRQLRASLEQIENVQLRLMPQYVHHSARLARTVASNASLAERSSKRVKRLDAILRHVQATSRIVEAMQSMQRDVEQIEKVMADGNVEKTVELLQSYDKSQRVLAAVSPTGAATQTPESHRDGLSSISASPIAMISETAIRDAKQRTQKQLMDRTEEAMKTNDKLTIMRTTRLLAELGEVETASNLYSQWIASHTIATLEKLIRSEMAKMDDPGQVAMTHLTLVSQSLDTVAAAFESEEEFTNNAFGGEGPLRLLAELHSRTTARCVPVLQDFIARRRDILAQLEQLSHDKQTSQEASGGAPSAVVACTRRADQTLEEISHIVSCGHIYLSFVQRKESQYQQPGTARAGEEDDKRSSGSARPATGKADQLWSSRDNALLNAMQDILAFYVPLQSMYFSIAYDQAVDLQLTAIRNAASSAGAAAASAKGKPSRKDGAAGSGRQSASPHPPQTSGALMAGLQHLYAVAASSADDLLGSADDASLSPQAQAEVAAFLYFTHQGEVTLHDDIFFVLRMAIHRAINTASAQISSAVVMSALDVVQSRLIPEIESHASVGQRSGKQRGSASASAMATGAAGLSTENFISPSRLHWTCAAQQAGSYLQKLADELQRLSDATFAGSERDVQRFRELASDMRGVGVELQKKRVAAWLEQYAGMYCDSVLPPHLDRFTSLSYDIKEEVYYHYELNDAWVQACLMDLAVGLRYLKQHLVDGQLYDSILAAIARRVAKAAYGVVMHKRFSIFGALQIDKDIRALRNFFVEHAITEFLPIRDAFAALALAGTLLLADSPRDALEESQNTALTTEEKRKILLSRAEFKKEEIMALPL